MRFLAWLDASCTGAVPGKLSDMQVEIATVAFEVTEGANGRVTIADIIWTLRVPIGTRVPLHYFALLSFEPDECDEPHMFGWRLIDPDARTIFEIPVQAIASIRNELDGRCYLQIDQKCEVLILTHGVYAFQITCPDGVAFETWVTFPAPLEAPPQ